MKGYLSIGKVAALKNVSIKSLRYYDEIGVLKPAYINPSTNYRYYTENQLFLLDAIILCLELGIPLRDLGNYVEDGKINLQNLLYDGKWKAEEKIKTIRNCLTDLQNCLEQYEHKPIELPKQSTYDRFIPKRNILTQELEDSDDDSNLSPKILRLFMLAQLLNVQVTYPSGIIYDYDRGTVKRSVFVTVEQVNDCEDKRIRVLKEGYYICHQHPDHLISKSTNILSSFIPEKEAYSIIETDIFEDAIRNHEANVLELQLWIGDAKK